MGLEAVGTRASFLSTTSLPGNKPYLLRHENFISSNDREKNCPSPPLFPPLFFSTSAPFSLPHLRSPSLHSFAPSPLLWFSFERI